MEPHHKVSTTPPASLTPRETAIVHRMTTITALATGYLSNLLSISTAVWITGAGIVGAGISRLAKKSGWAGFTIGALVGSVAAIGSAWHAVKSLQKQMKKLDDNPHALDQSLFPAGDASLKKVEVDIAGELQQLESHKPVAPRIVAAREAAAEKPKQVG